MSHKSIVFEMGILVGIAFVGALLFNHLRPHGLVLWEGVKAAQEAPASISAVPGKNGTVESTVSFESAQVLFRSGQALFVDARVPEHYQQGHISGAVSLLLDRIDETINAFLSDHGGATVIVTYCSGVYCPDAAHLAALLKDFGYSRVTVFRGGMEQWQKEGLPVE